MLYMVMGIAAVAFGEYFSKLYTNASVKTGLLLFAIYFVYTSGTFAWMGVMRNNNQLALMATIWSVATLATGVILGVVVFKESLSLTQWIGITLAFISTYLLIK